MTLTGPGSYTGYTYVNAGTLIYSGSNAACTWANCGVGTVRIRRRPYPERWKREYRPDHRGHDVVRWATRDGYGYYQMNGGTLTTGQLALGGNRAEQHDRRARQDGGALTVSDAGGWLIFGWSGSDANGALNIYGGTITTVRPTSTPGWRSGRTEQPRHDQPVERQRRMNAAVGGGEGMELARNGGNFASSSTSMAAR